MHLLFTVAWLRKDLCYTDLAQHLRTPGGQVTDHLYRDLFDV